MTSHHPYHTRPPRHLCRLVLRAVSAWAPLLGPHHWTLPCTCPHRIAACSWPPSGGDAGGTFLPSREGPALTGLSQGALPCPRAAPCRPCRMLSCWTSCCGNAGPPFLDACKHLMQVTVAEQISSITLNYNAIIEQYY